MNPIENFAAQLQTHYPAATATLDRPARANGTWWLDVTKGKARFHVAWSKKKGFGISSPDSGSLGSGHDEVYPDFDSAWKRLKSLFHSGARTRDPIASGLRAVRMEKHISQTNLARKLKIKQAALSKLERRDDMLVSSLADLVKALGGKLEIVARFNDRDVRLR